MAEQTLRDYVRAFEALDADRVAEFYHAPCLFLAPWGETVAATPEQARQIAAQLIEQARSQGYARTEIVDLRVELLAANLGSLQGMFIRRNHAGEEINRFGFRYALRLTPAGWKIVVALAHDPPVSQ